jgi:hypothetical protein
MQIYRINTENLEEFADQSAGITFANILAEWKRSETQYTLMRQSGQLENDQQLGWALARNTQLVNGYGALYRKRGRNYLWRGKRVAQPVFNRISNGLPDIEGEVLLYKRGASGGKNDEHYPIRLSNNRYAFVLGSVQHVLRGALDRFSIRINEPEQLLLFSLWAQEHLIDYDRLQPNLPVNVPNHFKTRAQYVWLMEQFINDSMFSTDFYGYAEGASDEEEENEESENNMGLRAAYCVWQNGEIIRWVRAGNNVHPKI